MQAEEFTEFKFELHYNAKNYSVPETESILADVLLSTEHIKESSKTKS